MYISGLFFFGFVKVKLCVSIFCNEPIDHTFFFCSIHFMILKSKARAETRTLEHVYPHLEVCI